MDMRYIEKSSKKMLDGSHAGYELALEEREKFG